MHATEFFAELRLPFGNGAVVGNTYYATPTPSSSLRIRISFASTIRADTYGGLRLAVLHPERGEIDAVNVTFLDHQTFHRRDEALRTPVGYPTYGTFTTTRNPSDRPPWEGAVTAGLRNAIERYTAVWFPGTWKQSGPRLRGHTAQRTPAPSALPNGGGRTL